MHRLQREENTNWITHAVGIGLSLIGVFVLVPRLPWAADWTLTTSCCVYLLALLAVYTCSTLSHWYTSEFKGGLPQKKFRQLDQACIYLLIVATYTPFSAAYLKHPWWWGVLGLMWSIAIVGFISKIFFSHRVNSVSIWIYLMLGWIPAFSGMPWSDQIPAAAIWSILLGGVVYSAGTIFLYNDQKQWYFHGIWHLFVIGGSLTHFMGILKLISELK